MEAGTPAKPEGCVRQKSWTARKARHTNIAFCRSEVAASQRIADSVTACVAPAAGWHDGCPLDGERSGACARPPKRIRITERIHIARDSRLHLAARVELQATHELPKRKNCRRMMAN